MTLLGIELRAPAFTDLVILNVLMLIVGLALSALVISGWIKPGLAFDAFVAATVGFCANAVGVSVARHGWRAVLIIVVAYVAAVGLVELVRNAMHSPAS